MASRELLLYTLVPYFGLSAVFYFKDDAQQRKKYAYVAPLVLLNLFVLLPPWMHRLLAHKWVVPCTNDRSNPKRILREGMQCLMLFEIFFYYSHRILHRFRFLYDNVHRVHHQLDKPIGLGALYAHPIEFIVCNLLPMSIGPMVLQTPLLVTLKLWLCFATSFVVVTHSGHVQNKHLEHHLTLKSAYGSLGFLDWLFSVFNSN